MFSSSLSLPDEFAAVSLLRRHFGHSSFRPLQWPLISNLLSGRDCFALLATGGGKSLIYQYPPLVTGRLSVVISPLIALMQDQVRQLKLQGIAAGALHSALSPADRQSVLSRAERGELRVLYLSPEGLPGAISTLRSLSIGLFAVDEAHCISEWGADFRMDYRNLSMIKAEFPSIPVLALTATATPAVMKDVINSLRLLQPFTVKSSFNRPNLYYSVRLKSSIEHDLPCSLFSHGSTIVYCGSRDQTHEVADYLANRLGLTARAYHAGLSSEERSAVQEAFTTDRVSIVVATIAFGMGIDKHDVRTVIHYSLPKSVEEYAQQTGRAGRDGEASECHLFYSASDSVLAQRLIAQSSSGNSSEQSRNTRFQLFESMKQFLSTRQCRRRYLLEYFHEWDLIDSGAAEAMIEAYPRDRLNCGNCDICEHELTEQQNGGKSQLIDLNTEARLAVQALSELGGNSTMGMLNSWLTKLTAKERAQLQERRVDLARAQTAGALKQRSRTALEAIWRLLAEERVLQLEQRSGAFGMYLLVSIGPIGQSILRQSLQLQPIKPSHALLGELAKEAQPSSSSGRNRSRTDAQDSLDPVSMVLFDQLSAHRLQLARERAVSAFIIFHNSTLREMAQRRPIDSSHFLSLPGVTTAKFDQFGNQFIQVIRRFCEEKSLPGNVTVAQSAPAVTPVTMNFQPAAPFPLSHPLKLEASSVSAPVNTVTSVPQSHPQPPPSSVSSASSSSSPSLSDLYRVGGVAKSQLKNLKFPSLNPTRLPVFHSTPVSGPQLSVLEMRVNGGLEVAQIAQFREVQVPTVLNYLTDCFEAGYDVPELRSLFPLDANRLQTLEAETRLFLSEALPSAAGPQKPPLGKSIASELSIADTDPNFRLLCAAIAYFTAEWFIERQWFQDPAETQQLLKSGGKRSAPLSAPSVAKKENVISYANPSQPSLFQQQKRFKVEPKFL